MVGDERLEVHIFRKNALKLLDYFRPRETDVYQMGA